MSGVATPAGIFVQAGSALIPLPVTRTPLGLAVAEMLAAIDSGELLPCRHCDAYGGCECEEWIEAMAPLPADPHADLTVWLESEIPF